MIGLLLMFALHIQAQNTYQLDYSDTSTFSVTCGNVNAAQWTVKQDSCMLYTPILYPTGTSGYIQINFIIRINQSGNLDLFDNAYIQHQLNDGSWITDTSLAGLGLAAVFTLNDTMMLAQSDYFRFRIVLETNASSQFWAIKDGDIIINNVSLIPPVYPVIWLDFSGYIDINTIKINWSTASETNNDYFQLEKSANGIDFEKLKQIQGAGNSNQINTYNITDDSPFFGNNYYRVKQVDIDGNNDFSSVIYISYNPIINKEVVLTMNQNTISILLDSDKETMGIIDVYNITGKLLMTKNIIILKGENHYDINSTGIKNGIHLIRITRLAGDSYIQRIVVVTQP